MGRSARNKANLKIRQPLQSINIYADDDFIQLGLDNKDQILEELNIKEINICKNRNDLVEFNIKPNYSTLALKAGNNMKIITATLQNTSFDVLMDSFKSEGCFKINVNDFDLEINQEDILVDEVALENFSVSTNQNIAVGVSTLITPALYNEGLIRDLIRYIQSLRKDSDLSVDDRIDLVIKYDDESLSTAIENHKEYLLNEVLGINIKDDLDAMDYSDSLKINNKKVIIAITINNKV